MGTRSADRRFWLRFNIAMACLGVLIAVLSDSLVERLAYVAFTAYWSVEAAHKARNIQRHGRWIDPSEQSGRASRETSWTTLTLTLAALFAVGLVIGLS